MKTVEMPKMGDTMEEGKILRWLKNEGESVKKGESLAEVETEKVNIEIEAFATGILRKILVPAGTAAPVGARIALIGAADEPLPGEASRNGTAATTSTTSIASVASVASTASATAAVSGGTTATLTQDVRGRVFISPIARRLAEEQQLDYMRIIGTGPNGRIIRLDVEAALAQQAHAALVGAVAQPVQSVQSVQSPQSPQLPQSVQPVVSVPSVDNVQEPTPAAADSDEFVEIPLTSMRRTIAKRLSQSMQTAPHFYMTSVIDTGKLAALRQQINEYTATDPAPIKVSINDLIVKAVARALLRMPQVNVSFAEDKLIQKKQVHIGIAVALEQGLIVPVLHHADQRSILDIARESHRLTDAARTGKLRPEDLSGGTFTVSNLGMFDVESFTAIINPPESAILAVGSITPTPVVVDGQVVVRDRVKVTLSSDHRALDGAIAARFLQEVKRLLEEPFGLLL